MSTVHHNGSLRLARRCPGQARALLRALGSVLTERNDGAAISRQLGAALAADPTPPAGGDLAALERALNVSLAELDLGLASLAAEDTAIVIRITDYPAVNSSPGQPEVVVFGLLEGYLTAYLNALSESGHLSARLAGVPAATDEGLKFVYKNHERQ